jgi:YVTN family beta-propeller protein
VIDGATNSTTTVAAGTYPCAVAVNPVTNKVYVANANSNNVTVIDGATNNTATVAAGIVPCAVAVNPVSNKVYVANANSNNVTVIDGATNSTTTVAAGTAPIAVAVNPVTNKVYVANANSSNVTILTEQLVSAIPLTTMIMPLANNVATVSNPTFSYTVASDYAPTAPAVQRLYYQVDTWTGPWLQAAPVNGAGSFTIPAQLAGIHTVYAFAGDGQEATSINAGFGSSPIPGAMTAYTLLIPTVTKGDVNNDSIVNVFDALLVLRYAVGLDHPAEEATFRSAADVAPLEAGKPKGDSQVNVFDALAILRHAVGLDPW